MCRLILILLLSALMGQSTFAEEKKTWDLEFSGSSATWYRHTPGRDRVIEDLILKLKLNLDNEWEVVAVAGHGPEWGNGLNNLYDSNLDNEFADAQKVINKMAIRNLYVQKALRYRNTQLQLQAGALNTEKGLFNAAALEAQGWIDGIRVKAKTELGDITFAAGGIDELTETNVYERSLNFNFYEIRLSRTVFEKLMIDVGAEHLDNELFLKAAGKYELNLVANRAIDLIGEVLYNTEDDTSKVSAGFSTDVGNLLKGKANGIRLTLRRNHLSPDMNNRGFWLTSGLNTSSGESASLAISGTFNDKKTFGWFFKTRDNLDRADTRIEFGVWVDFKSK